MFYIAYQRISANKGGMTAGVDGTTTDAMSLPRIEKLIDSLKDESYQPQPARRVYIPKRMERNVHWEYRQRMTS